MNLSTTRLMAVIVLEGFVVLAAEVMAIRLLMPYVGSGVEVVSVIITAVLLPMAYGYSVGGAHDVGSEVQVECHLQRNFLMALLFFTAGTSYLTVDAIYALLWRWGLGQSLFFVIAYCALFLIYPVYCLAQTVPLISYFFRKSQAQQVAGRVLFFSTWGSFAGAILTTLVLMNVFGVNGAACFIALALFMMMVLIRPGMHLMNYWGGLLVVLSVVLANRVWMHQQGILMQTPYSTISVREEEGGVSRRLFINRSLSAKVSQDEALRTPYLRYVEREFLPVNKVPYSVLVLGAGGFTLGEKDRVNEYYFVDIEKHLKHLSEQYLHQAALPANKHFIVQSAEAFVRQDRRQYQRIFIDVYSHAMHIPPQLVSREFYVNVKKLLAPGGILVMNVIGDPLMRDVFSQRMDNTIRSVFKHVGRQVIGPISEQNNILYSTINQKQDEAIYTNNLNTSSIDRL